MTRNVLYWHSISITVLYRIITHVGTLENHRLTAYLYKHYCFYKIIIAKLLALNVLSIALYTSKNFNNIYITKLSVMSCIENKKYTAQIIFKEEYIQI